MKDFLSNMRRGDLFILIAFAVATQGSDAQSIQKQTSKGHPASQSTTGTASPFADIQKLFGDDVRSDQAANKASNPIASFRPYTAPLANGHNQQQSENIPVAPKHAQSSDAGAGFHPFTEPTGNADQPPPGSTLKDDGHKDKLFNPQLSAHSNQQQYRSTTGYVLGKTGQYAMRYGPKIMRFIH
jgi:hypothetical protein